MNLKKLSSNVRHEVVAHTGTVSVKRYVLTVY